MRSFVLLSILGLVAADVTPAQQGQCLVDSSEAVSDALDAGLFIWAASKRCGKVGMDIKCEVDVASAVKSVNSMINVILAAVNKCEGLHMENKQCFLQASKLTKHIAGLTAAVGDIAQKCPAKPAAVTGSIAAPVMCTIDIKNTLKQLFRGIKDLRNAHDKCGHEDKRRCTATVLDIISSLSGMGGYLAGAIGQCKRTTALAGAAAAKTDTRKELCAQAAQDLVHHTSDVAEAGIQLSISCEQKQALFEVESLEDKTSTSSANLILGAFLPITAIVGFVGGRFYANHRAYTQQTREFMSDHE